ncbi:DUSP6 family protein [Megaselia abdita]
MNVNYVSVEWLQKKLCSGENSFIILDCRNSFDYDLKHIKNAINFSIPTILLRRLLLGKIDLLSTIRTAELRDRIEKTKSFVLYNDNKYASTSCMERKNEVNDTNANMMNVLQRRLLQQDNNCLVFCLQEGFSNFCDKYPEWCEENITETTKKTLTSHTSNQPDQLVGLSSLRISSPNSDSACSSSAESSESEINCHTPYHHPRLTEDPIEIISGLYLGNASHSRDEKALQKFKIKYILNVTPDLPNLFEDVADMHYLKIPIIDHFSQNLAEYFPRCITFIDEARNNGSAVLVHCLAGVSRSVTVTLAYLMQTESLSLNEAFSLVRSRKPDVSPNFDFMQQLNTFEQEIRVSSKIDYPNQQSSSEQQFMTESSKKYESVSLQNSLLDRIGASNAKTGVSPDSGIEFDRWTSSDISEGSSGIK